MESSNAKIYRFKSGFGEAEVLKMREDLSRQMQEAGVPGDNTYALISVLDEFCCNMMEHSSAQWVEIKVEPNPGSVNATLSDDGIAFDPTEAIKDLDPDQPASVSDRRLGLYMIALMAKDLRYRRDGGVNHLEFSLRR